MENVTVPIHNAEELEDLVTDEQYIIVTETCVVVWMTLSVLGALSNIVNIKIFISMGLSDGVTLSFFALAFFDLAYLTGTICLSVATCCYIMEMKSAHWFPVEPYAFVINFYNIEILINITNLLTTTFLAVARCMCVARPLQFKNTFTRSRTMMFLSLFVIFAVASYTPLLANMGLRVRFDPRTNTSRPLLWLSPSRSAVKEIIWVLVDIILPFATQLVVIVCVVILTNSLREASRFRQMSTVMSEKMPGKVGTVHRTGWHDHESDFAPISEKATLTGKDLRVIQQVVLISVVYIVCNVPRILNSVVCVVVPAYDLGKQYSNLYLSVNAVRKHFEIANSAVNFLIYYKYNTKFRQLCKAYL